VDGQTNSVVGIDVFLISEKPPTTSEKFEKPFCFKIEAAIILLYPPAQFKTNGLSFGNSFRRLEISFNGILIASITCSALNSLFFITSIKSLLLF